MIRKKLFSLILLLLFLVNLSAQEITEQELLENLKTVQGEERVKTLNELAWIYRSVKTELAIEYANEALGLSKKIGYNEGAATSLNRLGIVYKNEGNYSKAIKLYKEALEIEKLTGNDYGIGRAYYQLGNTFERLGLYTQALDYFNLALIRFDSLDDNENIGKTKNRIGFNLKNIGKYDEAILALDEALKIRQQIDDSFGIANSKLELALLYQLLEDYEKANDFLQESLAYYSRNERQKYNYLNALQNISSNLYFLKKLNAAKESYLSLLSQLDTLEVLDLEAAACNGLGTIYQDEKNYTKANEYYQRALKLFVELNDLQGIVLANANLGFVYSEQKDLERSNQYLERGLGLVDSVGDISLKLKILSTLSENYKEQGKWETSASLYSQYIQLNKSFEGRIQKALVSKNQLENDIVVLEKEYEKQRILFRSILLIFSLSIVLSFFAFKAYRNRQKAQMMEKNNALKQQEIDQLLSDIELKSTYAKLEGQDGERKRIAKDLHDRLGAILSTVKLYFKAIDDKIDELKVENQEQYNKAHELLDDAVKEVRSIAHDMQSGTLSKFGLIPEIEDLVSTLKKSNQIDISFFHYGIEERMDNGVEIQVYRMIQELISNVLKHADASKITVQITKEDNSVNILVEDNGKGFDIEGVQKGMGLKNIESRVDNLNGRLIVDSTKGKGTTISIDIEVDNKKENDD